MTRFSMTILVRLFLFICCFILFTIIFGCANDASYDAPTLATSTLDSSESNTVESQTTAQIATEQSFDPVTNETIEVTNKESIQVELVDSPILYSDVNYTKPITHTAAVDFINLLEYLVERLESECARNIYTESAVTNMQAEITRLKNIQEFLYKDTEQFLLWEAHYPYATKVWYFLRESGYSEEAAAGIIGNMMIETSGGTLSLKPTAYSPKGTYYGLCQWSIYYYPEIFGKPFEDQLDYLQSTIAAEFRVFGSKYKTGFTYADFLVLNSPEDAAHAFAAVYERCSTGSYELRKQAARTAYDYFTSEVR